MGTDPTITVEDEVVDIIGTLADTVQRIRNLNPTVADELIADIGDIAVFRDRLIGGAS